MNYTKYFFASLTIAITLFTSVPVGAEGDNPSDQMVTRMYQTLLEREPDTEGLDYWSTQLDRGTNPEAMVRAFLGTPEGAEKQPSISDVYERTLMREPDAKGKAYWELQDYTSAVVSITNSPEAADIWGHELFETTYIATAESDFVTRLYVVLLDREPDVKGREHWERALQTGVHPVEMVETFLGTPEGAEKQPSISDVYERTLMREPDASGLLYWETQDYVDAVVSIAASPEAVNVWDHILYDVPPQKPFGTPDYFVETVNGVWLPPVLLEIRWCESRDDYNANNKRSSASGAYQFIQSTARYIALSVGREDLVDYGDHVAGSWDPVDQDKMALVLWEDEGTTPWNASRHCWG